jgi:hypothetical protein
MVEDKEDIARPHPSQSRMLIITSKKSFSKTPYFRFFFFLGNT